jgi:two-component system sensor histidine kinase/response regulator
MLRHRMTTPAASPPQKTVLVIDDEPMTLDVVCYILEAHGFKVVRADDGWMGLEAARAEHPDLVLCDVVMPRLDGYAVLHTLRAEPETAAIPFILLTGEAGPAQRRRGMEAGADDYLAKPVAPQELLNAVRARLAKAEAFERRLDGELAQLRDSITRFFPHELLSPLTTILGFSGLLSHQGDLLDRGEVKEAGDRIHAAALRLRRMAGNILMMAELDLMDTAGGARTPARSEGEKVIGDAARTAAERWGRDEDLLLEIGPVCLPWSEAHLSKAVEELVDNACKFSPARSRIHILLQEAAGGGVDLVVADKGRGMTPEQIRGVGPYLQFDRREIEQQGSGLGLALVKRLTERAGGTLEIEPNTGGGTRVRLALPAAAPAPETPAA